MLFSANRWLMENVALARAKFPDLLWSKDFSWFLVPNLPLTRRWNRRTIPLLIVQKGVFADFKTIPPDNFYTSPGLKFTNGLIPGHILYNHCFNDKKSEGWARISWHIEAATYNPAPGTHLLTILTGLQKFFRTVKSVE